MNKIKLNTPLKILIIIFIIIIFIIIIFTLTGLIYKKLMNDNIILNEYQDSDYEFTYDSNFNLNKKDNYIILSTNNKKTNIVINKIDFPSFYDNNKRKVSLSLTNNIVNEDYQEISRIENENEYFYLFENYKEKKEIEVITLFKNNYLYLIVYSSNTNDFDLYYSSLNIIINSLKEDNYEKD